LTVVAQGEAIETRVATPAARAGNALISVFVYLRQTVCPVGLCCFYPYNLPFPLWKIACGTVTVTGLIFAVVVFWRRAPLVAIGAAWYMAALVPVIGLVQVGSASHADRYTYLAAPGLSIALAGAVRSVLSREREKRGSGMRSVLYTSVGASCLAALLGVTVYYQSFWRDTVTLFERALAVTERNAMAYTTLAEIHARTPGMERLAGEYWRKALEINRNCETLANVALLLLQTEPERRDEAYSLAQEALHSIAPGTGDKSGSENELGQRRANLALGLYHLQRCDWPAAAQYLSLANNTDLFTGNPLYWEWCAIVLYHTDRLEQALDAIGRALQLMPNHERYVAMQDVIGRSLQARQEAGEP